MYQGCPGCRDLSGTGSWRKSLLESGNVACSVSLACQYRMNDSELYVERPVRVAMIDTWPHMERHGVRVETIRD